MTKRIFFLFVAYPKSEDVEDINDIDDYERNEELDMQEKLKKDPLLVRVRFRAPRIRWPAPRIRI